METLTLARFLCEMTLQEYDYARERPSKLAASCLLLALTMKNLGGWVSPRGGGEGEKGGMLPFRSPPSSPRVVLADPHVGVLQRVPRAGPAPPGEEAEFPAHLPALRQAEGRAHQIFAQVSLLPPPFKLGGGSAEL